MRMSGGHGLTRSRIIVTVRRNRIFVRSEAGRDHSHSGGWEDCRFVWPLRETLERAAPIYRKVWWAVTRGLMKCKSRLCGIF